MTSPSFLASVVFRALAISAVTAGLSFTTAKAQDLPRVVAFDAATSVKVEANASDGVAIDRIVVDPSGGFFAAGSPFTNIDGTPTRGIVRFRPDLTVDDYFQLTDAISPTQICAAADGGVFVLAAYNENGATSELRLRKYSSTGKRITSFAPSFDGEVSDIASDASGNVFAVGRFTTVNGVARSGIARFDASGNLDLQFSPDFTGTIETLFLLPSGRILLAGAIGVLEQAPVSGPVLLGTDGQAAAGLNQATLLDGHIVGAIELTDGSIILAGSHPLSFEAGAAGTLAKFDSEGDLDPNFPMLVQPNHGITSDAQGHIVLLLSNPYGLLQQYLRLITPDGSPVTTDIPDLNGEALTAAVLPGGQIVLGGRFTVIDDSPRLALAAIAADGTLAATVNPVFRTAGKVNTITSDDTGGLLVGGQFDWVDNQPRQNLAWLHADGNLDSNVDFQFDHDVDAAVLLNNNAGFLIGGRFTSINGTGYGNAAKLNSDGRLAGPELVGNPGDVTGFTRANDGRIFATGSFYLESSQLFSPLKVYTPTGSPHPGFMLPLSDQSHRENVFSANGPGATLLLAGDIESNVGAGFGITRIGSAANASNGFVDDTFAAKSFRSNPTDLALFGNGNIALVGPSGFFSDEHASAAVFLGPDGEFLPTPFTPWSFPETFDGALELPSGGLLLYGRFQPHAWGAAAAYGLIQVTASGEIDPGFQFRPGNSRFVFRTSALDSKGRLWIGGVEAGGYSLARLDALQTNQVEPVVVSFTQDEEFVVGGTLTLSVTVADLTSVRYLWRKGETLFEETGSTLTIEPATLADAGTYEVVAYNDAGGVRVSGITAVDTGPPSVFPIVGSNSAVEGATATLTANFHSSQPVTFQWARNGTNLPDETDSTLELRRISPEQSGFYSVTVSNRFGDSTPLFAHYLEVSPLIPDGLSLGYWSLGFAGGTYAITIETASGWTIGDTPDWVSFSALEGTGHATIQVTLEANESLETRTATVLIGGYEHHIVQPGLAGMHSWTAASSTNSNLTYHGVTAGSAGFVAVGSAGGVSSSTDGTSWADLTPFTVTTLNDIVYGNGLYVAVGGSGEIWTSPDAMTWSPRTSGTSYALNAIVWSGERFVAVGGDFSAGADATTSIDGVTWEKSSPGAAFLYAIGYADGKFLASGYASSSYISSNGTTWSPLPSPPSFEKDEVAGLDGVGFVGVGDPSFGISSTLAFTDITTEWEIITPPTNDSYWAINSEAGFFLGGGQNGTLIISVDGRSWSSQSSGANATILNFAYDGTRFVAVGREGMRQFSGAVGPALSAPQITEQPADAHARTQETVTLQVVATGQPTPTYRWRKDGKPIGGGFAAQLVLTDVRLKDAGSYDVVVTSATGEVISDAAVVTISDAPTFELHPLDTTIALGGSIQLEGLALGTPAPTYQWFFDDNPLNGATEPKLVLGPITLAQAGKYQLEATNTAGRTLSNPAQVEVLTPPTIQQQPVTVGVLAGGTASFSVVASGNPAVSYQWRRNGRPIDGAMGPSYSLSPIFPGDGARYDVVVTNSVGTVTSVGALLEVDLVPSFFAQPEGGSFALGSTAELRSPSSGLPLVDYQWFKNGQPLIGENAATLSFPSLNYRDAGEYFVMASNRQGSVTSESARIEVTGPPSILAEPSTQLVLLGAPATFSVTVDSPSEVTYQWNRNGMPLEGATTRQLTIAAAAASDQGFYTVTATNSSGSTRSIQARLALTTEEKAPTILAAPRDVVALVGTTREITVAATGTGTLIYEWRTGDGVVSGATGPTFILDNIAPIDAGSYTVTVSNSLGNASATAQLRVITQSFAGIYFGSFGPNRGSFALMIGDDNTGEIVGFDQLTELYLREAVTIDAEGNFAVVSTQSTTTTATQKHFSIAATAIVLSGQIGITGTVSGSVEGVAGLILSGAIEKPTTSAAYAGLYESREPNGQRSSVTLISPSGKALTLIAGPAGFDGGIGTVSENGALSLTTASGVTLVGTVNGTDQTLTTTLTSGSESIALEGANATTLGIQRLVNISTRARVGNEPGAEAIAGISISGVDAKTVLIRAVGPSLSAFPLSGLLPRPQLELHHDGAVIAANYGWGNASNRAEIMAATAQAFAFPLDEDSLDAVIVVTLEPGLYTAVATDQSNTPGIVLIEIYDLSETVAGQKLINISTRASVGIGDDVCIAGFVISGSVPKTLLIRGVGPSLGKLGVDGVLLDPQIELHHDGMIIATNDDWSDNIAVSSAGAATYAFELLPGSKDAALVVTLSPGVYTAIMRGAHETTGIGLIEIYEVP